MSEMIERVARAIAIKHGIDPDGRSSERRIGVNDGDLTTIVSDHMGPLWTLFADDARAAIEAMREPTKEMVVAGDDAKDECIDQDWDSDADGNRYDYTIIRSDLPARVFRAMIDAALAPQEE